MIPCSHFSNIPNNRISGIIRGFYNLNYKKNFNYFNTNLYQFIKLI